MLNKLYKRYFDKDRPARHYTQHLFVALVGYSLTITLFNIDFTLSNLLIFILFSYLPDLDAILAAFITVRKNEVVSEIKKELKKGHFYRAGVLATTYHKEFTPLIFHNYLGLTLLLGILSIFIVEANDIGILCSMAFLAHFIFDILDDIYQLGHVKNWTNLPFKL